MTIRYGGADIKAFARVIKEEKPSGKRDWSMDIAYLLAMALVSLNQLEKAGIDLAFQRRKLIVPHLERAWRELVYLRRRRLSDEFVLNDIPRSITLSKRSGRILIHEDQERADHSRTHTSRSRDLRTSGGSTPYWQRKIDTGRRPRFRRGGYKRKLQSDIKRLRGHTDTESD